MPCSQERVIANLAVISNFLAGRGSYKKAAAAPVDELAANLPRLLQVHCTRSMTPEPSASCAFTQLNTVAEHNALRAGAHAVHARGGT